MDNISSLRALTPEVLVAPAHLFEVAPALRQPWGGGGRKGPADAARNPSRGVMIEYYLAEEPASEVTLTVTDAGGETIRQFSSISDGGPRPATLAGTNRFFWDMR